MAQAVSLQVLSGASILLIMVFGVMVVVSVLGAAGWITVRRRASNALFVAAVASLVAGVLLMLSTALL